jgi:hypothetical protein
MSRGFELSTQHYPILYLKIGAKYDETDFRALERDMAPIYARRAKFVMIVKTEPNSYLPDARTRKIVVEWWKSMEELQKAWNAGTAIVVASAPIRGALTALSWLFTPPTPQIFVRNLDEAVDWAEAQLREAGIAPPPTVRSLRQLG